MTREEAKEWKVIDANNITYGLDLLIDKIYDEKETCEGCSYVPESSQNFPMECSQCRRFYADGYIARRAK